MSMLREIGVELQAALRSRGISLPVLDRETTATATFARERIVLEHSGNDSFGPPKAQRNFPKQVMTRSISAKLTIYVKSPKAAALHFEHERRAETVLDMVLVSMHEVVTKRKTFWVPGSGRFLLPEDLQASESPGGAAYELTFDVMRGVYDQTPSSVAFGEDGVTITSTTEVGLAMAPDVDVEIGCGG